MAELADALDLGSSGATHQSSSLCSPISALESPSASRNYAGPPCGSSSVVEHRLAKARVASSNLVFRSMFPSQKGPARTVSSASVKHLDPTQVELEIEISEAELDAARERAFRRSGQERPHPRLPAGQSAAQGLRGPYGTEAIAERAMDRVVREPTRGRSKRTPSNRSTSRRWSCCPRKKAGRCACAPPFRCARRSSSASTKASPVDAQPTPASDEDLERSLESLRRETAALVPVDRPVESATSPPSTTRARSTASRSKAARPRISRPKSSKTASFPGFVAASSACAPANKIGRGRVPRGLLERRTGRQEGRLHA